MDKLHDFAESHINEDCSALTGNHENELFYGCRFERLNGLTLKDCDLNASHFATSKLRDALGVTLSLNCKSFKNVRFSEMAFDLILMLLTMTTGNDEKKALIKTHILGEVKYKVLSRLMGAIE